MFGVVICSDAHKIKKYSDESRRQPIIWRNLLSGFRYLDNKLRNSDKLPLSFADQYSQPAVVLRTPIAPQIEETPWHQHKRGQLILPLSGAVISYIADGIWVVPPRCAVWIPGNVPHRNRMSANADVCMLFIAQDAAHMPKEICTLSITPLVRELIVHLATVEQNYTIDSATHRLVEVLLEQLVELPKESFDFPIPDHPKLHHLAHQLLQRPQEKRTLKAWAADYAMSERTMARLIKHHTQLTFGQWRSQLHIVLALQKLAEKEPVQRIAETLGYESVSAFITFFKKTLGKPPQQYRHERWGE